MPEKRFKSKSFKKVNKVTYTGNVIHYRRGKNNMPHCAICGAELNGISTSPHGGKSRRSNSRIFGGNLCANCTADIIMLGSRVERGEIKLDDISIKQRAYVLQMMAH
ncbi:MAG: hypothetical protein QXD11_02235 [Candidatus Micrarchaeaceae archaeon]